MLFFMFIGIAAGLGLRYLGAIGQVLVWFVILFQIGWMGFILFMVIGAYREAARNQAKFKMPYGGLTEYGVAVTYFGCGLMSGYWLTLPWSLREIMILGVILLLLTGATMVYAKGQRRHQAR